MSQVGAASSPEVPSTSRLLALSLSALGVVYGDIGTSPLYALKECFAGSHPVTPDATGVMGVLSLVFWSLAVVVSVKYLGFIMRADNRGEGGIFALLALVPTGAATPAWIRSLVMALALGSAALLFGDGIITPSISVLSAVEGLRDYALRLEPLVVPITCVVLLVLFLVQKRGTGRLGSIFGPVMVAWFLTIGGLGLVSVLRHPDVLWAVNPVHAARFLATNGAEAFLVLGAVTLSITGGEALYADLGHFGRGPIRLSWFSLVFPALLLSYFGQGALVLHRPEAAASPFYGLVPRVALLPMVALATVATVLASQAMISGAFSLTRQAVQLGFVPRMNVVHTSGETAGQVYIPGVNAALMIGCLALVLAFRSTEALASAYGLAVTADMTITSIVFLVVIRWTWGWSWWRSLPLVGLFLVFDVSFLGANVLKFFHGAWVPVVLAVVLIVAMSTWRDGREELARRLRKQALPLDLLLDDIQTRQVPRVPGTAVFMSASTEGAPPALLHHLKHNKMLHEQVVLLAVEGASVPVVPRAEQLELHRLREGFFRLTVRYGFMQMPNVPDAIKRAAALGLTTDVMSVSYFLSHETLLTTGPGRMWRWRKRLFAFITRNARPATHYFGLPPGRVVELGIQIDL
jgi:KUP system potassium uptake protein